VILKQLLQEHERTDLLRLLTAGSVDDGKSTLIGRLLHDSKLVLEDQLAAVQKASAAKGAAGGEVDLSLLLDGLRAEREQGITIDVAYRYFSTPRRKFIIADTPGHEQYTRNMATGASTADLAIILLDARKGVLPQTRRHSFIATLLGIRHLVVAVNKMDLVGYDEDVFNRIKADYTGFAARLDVSDVHFIPLSALKGDNVVDASASMPWYKGSALLDYLESVHIASDRNLIDMRFPVQYVIRPNTDFRGYCGTVASGVLRPRDEVVVLPSGKRSRVKAVYAAGAELAEAFPPVAITVTLEDDIDISRGDMIAHVNNTPHVSTDIEAMVVWMSEAPLVENKSYAIKHTTAAVHGISESVRYKTNVNTLRREESNTLALNEIGRVRFALNRPISCDAYARNRATGAFVIIDRITNNTLGAGMIVDRPSGNDGSSSAQPRSRHVHVQKSALGAEDRASRLGHESATVWLTGLPKSGKSTIAYALEKRLFDAGCASHVIDGENMRLGVSRDLGFSAADRTENIRRAASVARIANDAGLITIAAFVSPSETDRADARQTVGADRFLEIYLNAPLEECVKRDAEGLYEKARAGEIAEFSGVSAPYDEPSLPDLTLPTHELSIEACVEKVMALLRERGVIPKA
jgi:bifunctional enzyme CysN/CysC